MSRKVFKAGCALAADHGETICIGGGEPTLHPLFWDFIGIALSYADDPGMIWLATNGKKTEDALQLARLARNGVIAVALSLDKWHDPIDTRVGKAFTEGLGGQRFSPYNNDLREIRNVEQSVKPFGRAVLNSLWKTPGCVCDTLSCDPDGNLYACGCQTEKLGTVFAPDFGSYWEWDEKCPMERKLMEITQ
jgi:hypothetical protein